MKISAAILVILLAYSCSHGEHHHAKFKKEKTVIGFFEDNKKFEGTLILPKKFDAKIPAVIVVHEWWGKNDYSMKRGHMLADAGFAALVIDLFGDNKTADNPTDAQALATPLYQNANLGVERLNKYLTELKKDPHVNPEKVYVIGYCFGGTQALNLARSGADFAGVASFHGGLGSSIKTVNALKPKLLVLNGAVDPLVPPKDVAVFKKEMKAAHANLKFVNYEGAMHAFTNPAATEVGKKYKMPVAYDEKADLASWNELIVLLKN